MKKQIMFVLLCLCLLFFAQKSQAQTEAGNFGELAFTITNAPVNPSSTTILITADILTSTGNLSNIVNETFIFISSTTSGTTLLDGNNSFSGFSADSASSLSFENINFQNAYAPGTNPQYSGGFINVRSGSTATLTSSDDLSFYNGKATSNSVGGGGALHANTNSRLILSAEKNIIFASNTASLAGGAVNINTSYASFTATDTITFAGNKSNNGGAIYAQDSEVDFNGNTIFTDNSGGITGGSLGGAFRILRSTVNFNGTVNFSHNASSITANGQGGGMSIQSSSVEIASSAYFTGNESSYIGGGFSLSANSLMLFGHTSDFTNNYTDSNGGGFHMSNSVSTFTGTAKFTGNKAGIDGGGFYAYNNSYLYFSSNSVFTSNISENDGGGFFVNGSRIHFNGLSEFIDNEAEYRGAGFYSYTNSNIVFDGGAVFKDNKALQNNGGGFYAERSTITFASAIFESNESVLDNGGGFYSLASTISFSGDTQFISNKSYYTGGGIAAGARLGTQSSISFLGNVLFSSNIAGSYGAGISATNSSIYFSSAATFTNNEAQVQHGGAIAAVAGSSANFDGTAQFIKNKAFDRGGALYAEDSAITFASDSYFSENEADFGGAISLEYYADLTLSDVVFSKNEARAEGGAVYLEDYSNLTVNTSSRSVFSENTANGKNNALYVGSFSQALFNTSAGAIVQMYDAISGNGNSSALKIDGAGNFNLYNTVDTVDITIGDLSAGTLNLAQSGSIDSGKFTVNSGSKFNMQNSKSDTVKVAELNSYGSLAMDIFESDGNDQIFSAGDVNLSSTSKLELQTDLTNKRFKKKTYKLINFNGDVNKDFIDVSLSGITLLNKPEVFYGEIFANWITVSLIGDSVTTGFSKLGGLTFNQKQTAKTYDLLSLTSTGDLDAIISLIEGHDDAGQKKALAQASGYFLANIIRSVAANAENNEIYDRIKNHCPDGHSSNGLWGQLRGAAVTYSKDENSLNDFKDTSYGAMIGFDRFMEDNGIMLGAYGKYTSHDISQDPENEANINSTGLGFYGGFVKKSWEIKALISGSYDTYNTTRYIPFADRKAKADFDGTTLGADIEGALKFGITEFTDLRPYAGLEAKNSHYSSFSEKGADSLDIDVLGGTYTRSAARLGVGAVYDNALFSWYVSGEAKYLINGEEPEIEGNFSGTSALFRSRGTTEGDMIFGALVGASVKLNKELKLFINGNFYAADRYQNIYGNIGIRYTFCSTAIKEPKPVYDTAPSVAKMAPAPPEPEEAPIVTFEEIPVIAPDPEPEPEPITSTPEPEIDMEDENVAAAQTAEAAKRREKPVLKAFSLNMANFATGKSELTEKAKENIRLQADEIKQFTFDKITIEGHTDSTGGAALNRRLSKERAKAVHDIFVEEGIPSEKISYIGFSSLIPVASNKTADGRAQNRRVEIFVE